MEIIEKILCIDCGVNCNLFRVRTSVGNIVPMCGECFDMRANEPQESDPVLVVDL